MTTKNTINISTSTILRMILIVLCLVFLYVIRDVLILLFFAIVVASAIDLPAKFLEKLKIPRVLSVLIVYLVAIGVLVGLLILFIPTLAREVKDFSTEFPNYADWLYQKVQKIQDGSLKYQRIVDEIQNIIGNLGEKLRELASNILSKTLGFFGGIFSALIIIVVSFYLAVQKHGIENLLRGITPKKHETYVLNLWARAQKKMGHWFQGQLFLALIVGILVYVGLSILHIRFAFLLAILAGILELVPYIGPVISAVPAVILAFFQAPILAVWIVVMYVLVQQLENYILVPLVVRKAIGVNPVVIIIALLIGGKLLGIIGVILAVPIAAIAAEFFKDIKRK